MLLRSGAGAIPWAAPRAAATLATSAAPDAVLLTCCCVPQHAIGCPDRRMVRDVAQNVSSGFDPTFASQIFQYPGHRGS
jgi:hypothetical protein